MAGKDEKKLISARNTRGGPVTVEGREVVSYNATTHGLRSSRVLPWESQVEHDAMHAAVVEYLAPQDAIEAEAVQGFAAALWRLRRVGQAEALHFEKCMHLVRSKRQRLTDPSGSRLVPLSQEGFSIDAESFLVGVGGTSLANIVSYETTIQRSARRWLEILEKMRKLHRGDGEE